MPLHRQFWCIWFTRFSHYKYHILENAGAHLGIRGMHHLPHKIHAYSSCSFVMNMPHIGVNWPNMPCFSIHDLCPALKIKYPRWALKLTFLFVTYYSLQSIWLSLHRSGTQEPKQNWSWKKSRKDEGEILDFLFFTKSSWS